MREFLTSTSAQVILATAGLAVALAVGFYVIAKVRAGFADSRRTAHEDLAGFRELHAKGELNDKEFRTIKGLLADQLQRELNDSREQP